MFDNPDTAHQYQPAATWENAHRFNPLARWTWGEEASLVRKLDVRIMIWACVMLMVQELDRANLTQALTDNFLHDLHMDTNDYNTGQTIFKMCYLFAELPLQLISKRVGPDRWLPIQMTLWGTVATCQFWINSRSSFLLCRALLGTFQGGFNPQVILYLSNFYKHHELAIRIGFYYTAMGFADMFASVLAFGILHMRGVGGHAGWKWLFLLEVSIPPFVSLSFWSFSSGGGSYGLKGVRTWGPTWPHIEQKTLSAVRAGIISWRSPCKDGCFVSPSSTPVSPHFHQCPIMY